MVECQLLDPSTEQAVEEAVVYLDPYLEEAGKTAVEVVTVETLGRVLNATAV